MEALVAELKELIFSTLGLPENERSALASSSPLFGKGDGAFGLDSIDALEIAAAVSKKYNVRLRADDQESEQALSSLEKLAQFIAANRS